MKKQPNKYLRFVSSGFQIGITIWLGNELGKWLDKRFENDIFEPLITLFSVFVAMFAIISQVIKISKEND